MIAIKGMEELPSCCRHCPCSDDLQCNLTTQYNDLKDRPDDCPLIEIVTCKDCKHKIFLASDGKGNTTYMCDKHCGNIKNDDFYCADGERRE